MRYDIDALRPGHCWPGLHFGPQFGLHFGLHFGIDLGLPGLAARRVDGGTAALGIGTVEQFSHRHRHEVGVGRAGGAVGRSANGVGQ